MFQLLLKPYPVQANKRHMAWTAVMVGLFIWLFLQTFQPFGLHDFQSVYKPLILAGYGIITLLVMLLFGYWLYHYISRHPQHELSWSIGRHMLYTFSHVSSIALANFFYSTWVGLIDSTLSGFLFYIFATFSIAFFPIIGLTLWSYIHHLRRHLAGAAMANNQLKQRPSSPVPTSTLNQSIILYGDNKAEHLEVLLQDLLHVNAAGNYVEVHWLHEKQLHKQLLRSSLSRIEEQLLEVTDVKRCHRSYLVNLSLVEKVSGNAQGYILHLASNSTVPVGRSYAPAILQHLP